MIARQHGILFSIMSINGITYPSLSSLSARTGRECAILASMTQVPSSTATRTPRRWRPIGFALIIVALTALLGFDLAGHGLAWQVIYNLTGEEAPLAQIRGLIELGGNLLRQPPRLDPYVPIDHAGVNPFGINTFLEQEAEVAKRERTLRLISEAGFAWIRQQFVWEDIEIHGRGDFVDRRNDLNGDGTPDAVDAWAKYDNIVALAEHYGLMIQARLDNPPAWAQTVAGDFAPPADFQDFVNFAAAVAERYRGRIRYYQVWNEPNIYPEWGEQAVNPEAYTELLCRTYDALKAVDPEIVVISAPLSPTVSLTARDLNDLIFLQRMYDAGAGACFDVLAMQGYGFFSGPTDQRMRPTTLTFARNLYLRDLMIANDDASTPIWITEAAWNPIDAPDVPPDVSGRANYGIVTPEQAAAFMPGAYERAQREWPWIGVIDYWFFKRAADYERGQSWYYFRMVEPDFTPLPVYESMRAYIAGLTPTLYRGVHQEDHWALTPAADSERVLAPGAQFDRALRTTAVSFRAHGTETVIRWRGAALTVTVDDTEYRFTGSPDGWTTTRLPGAIFARSAEVALSAAEPFLLDSITVYDLSFEHALAGGLAAVALLIALLGGIVLWRR
jgi:hypothetical protein